MLVDCMWSFGCRLEGGGEDSHKACNLFELPIVVSNHRAISEVAEVETYADMWGHRG